MQECKRCKRLMNGEPWHDSILWCMSCWRLWCRGPMTQALSQEFIRDSEPPTAKRDICVCGKHYRTPKLYKEEMDLK